MKKSTLAILVIGTLASGLLSHGSNIFYNFLILPLLGVVAYVGLRNKWHFAVLGIGVITFMWQFITMAADGMFAQKLYLETLTGAFSMTFIYLTFVFLGVALGALLTVAFTRNKERTSPMEGTNLEEINQENVATTLKEEIKTSKVEKSHTLIRVVSGVMGLGIILGIASLVNAFTGNPISGKLAQDSAQRYIDAHYSAFDLEISKASYNFKFDTYMVRATSKTSPDTHFSIDVDSFGHVESDDYEGSVLSGSNTYRRLNEGYEDFVEPYIEKNMPYDFDMIIAQLDDREPSAMAKLKRDATYDVAEMPMKGLITVYLYSDDLSWENVAKVTLELNALLEKANLDVTEYTVVLEPLIEKTENRGESFGIYDFPKEKLKNPDLAKEMEVFFNIWNQGQK